MTPESANGTATMPSLPARTRWLIGVGFAALYAIAIALKAFGAYPPYLTWPRVVGGGFALCSFFPAMLFCPQSSVQRSERWVLIVVVVEIGVVTASILLE